jgi:hypothetical protein
MGKNGEWLEVPLLLDLGVESAMLVDLTTPTVRRFATIFRRECDRTAIMTDAVIYNHSPAPLPSLDVAARADVDMDGYDEWAAAAYGMYVSRSAHHPTTLEQAGLACALSRSPLCEVMFAEIQLAQGRLPYEVSDQYNHTAYTYMHVRFWPTFRGRSAHPLRKMLLQAAYTAPKSRFKDYSQSVDPVGLLLADQPWMVPLDVATDPAYSSQIPMAKLSKTELDLDLDGLRKRMDHEMLVVEAAFDDEAAKKLHA